MGEPTTRVPLTQNKGQRVYVVVWRNANPALLSTRAMFGDMCVQAFGRRDHVDYYCASIEEQTDGGLEYLVSIRLTHPQRWQRAREHLANNNVVAEFHTTTGGFYTNAYGHVTKSDQDFFLGHVSKEHPPVN